MKKYLAVDLGRTHLKYAVITEELDVLNEGKLSVPVDNKEKLFNAYKQVADLYRGQVEGMALTMPGVIDMEKGFAYSGGVYLWVRNMSYGEELSQYISMKVAICNDAKAAALAEIGYGSLKKVRNGVLLLILNTGIGGAVVADGQLLNGERFAAGEFSYMRGDYLDRENKQDMFAFSSSIDRLCKIVSQYTGAPTNIMKIMAGLAAGDENVKAGVRQFCDQLATHIYNIQCVLDSQRIVIGGNITDEPGMMEQIREAIDRKFDDALYHNIYKPEIREVTFHNNSRMFGGVYLFRRLYEESGK